MVFSLFEHPIILESVRLDRKIPSFFAMLKLSLPNNSLFTEADLYPHPMLFTLLHFPIIKTLFEIPDHTSIDSIVFFGFISVVNTVFIPFDDSIFGGRKMACTVNRLEKGKYLFRVGVTIDVSN